MLTFDLSEKITFDIGKVRLTFRHPNARELSAIKRGFRKLEALAPADGQEPTPEAEERAVEEMGKILAHTFESAEKLGESPATVLSQGDCCNLTTELSGTVFTAAFNEFIKRALLSERELGE